MLSKKMHKQTLIEAGLSEKQATVYLACLSLGKARVPEIATRASIKRTTVYGIIKELMEMGLISYSSKGKQRYIRTQDPEIILRMLEKRKQNFEKILPDLGAEFATYNIRPDLQFFEGREGARRIFEDTLNCKGKKIRQIVRVEDFVSFVGERFAREYIKRRVQKDVIAHALNPISGDMLTDYFGKTSKALKRQTRYLPKENFYTSMIMIYDNKVAMVSTKKEQFGFIIESKEFANTYRSHFDFMWDRATRNEPA